MKKTLPLIYTLLLCIMLATIDTAYAQTSTIYVDPSSKTVNSLGQLFTIDINIANAPTMDFYDIYNITWDPAVIELEHGTDADIVEGPFLKSLGDTLFTVKPPELGRIENIACGLLPNVEASGSGTLFTIKFRSKAVGTSDIKIELAYIMDVMRDPNWVEYPKLNSGTVLVRIPPPPKPVGGYSISIQVNTRTEPVLPYIALIATITAIFTKLRPKAKRKR